MYLKIVHQAQETQARKDKIYSALATRCFEKGPSKYLIMDIFQSTCKL